MNFLYFIIALLLPLSILKADCEPNFEECNNFSSTISDTPTFLENIPLTYCKPWTLNVRVAYYRPQSKEIKNMYSQSWIDFQVETSRTLMKYLDCWIGVSWTGKQHGKTEPFRYYVKDKTKFFLLPVSIGLRLIYPILPCTELYLGAGVCYSFLEIRNHFKEDGYSSSCSSYYFKQFGSIPYKHHIHKSNWGGIFKAGVHYTMCDSTFLDIFVDYYLQDFHFSDHSEESRQCFFKKNANCSGFKIGAGLGVYF